MFKTLAPVILILCVFAVLSTSTAQDCESMRKKMRDLSLYNKAGPYTINFNKGGKLGYKQLGEVRRFLWEHWQQRRFAHITTTFYSKEGEQNTTSFYIERDENGSWCVLALKLPSPPNGQLQDEQLSVEAKGECYDIIERIEAAKSKATAPKLIAEKAIRQPLTYWLWLRNARTKKEIVL